MYQMFARRLIESRRQRANTQFFGTRPTRHSLRNDTGNSRQRDRFAKPQQPFAARELPVNYLFGILLRSQSSPRRAASVICSPARAEIAMMVNVGS